MRRGWNGTSCPTFGSPSHCEGDGSAFSRAWGFKLLRRYQDVVQSYYGVLQGRTSAEQFLAQAKTRVKACSE